MCVSKISDDNFIIDFNIDFRSLLNLVPYPKLYIQNVYIFQPSIFYIRNQN